MYDPIKVLFLYLGPFTILLFLNAFDVFLAISWILMILVVVLLNVKLAIKYWPNVDVIYKEKKWLFDGGGGEEILV